MHNRLPDQKTPDCLTDFQIPNAFIKLQVINIEYVSHTFYTPNIHSLLIDNSTTIKIHKFIFPLQ